MRWTRQRFARDGMAGRVERLVSDQQRADERCCSVRRSRVVLTLRRWRQVRGVKSAQPGLDKTYPRATVANKPGHRGARRKPLKPLRAGTSGDSGVLVYSCAFYQYQVHTRPRVQRASGVPHALYWARDFMQGLGRFALRGRTRVCCLKICINQYVVPAKAGTHTPCPIILGAEAEAFCTNERRWLWVPAFAGTTKESGWGGCERAARWVPRARRHA